MDDPLAILGLKPGDSLQKAKKRRNALCLQYHPDKRPNEASAAKQYRRVQDAYEAIKNNPSLLEPIQLSNSPNSFLELEVDLEDFYFGRTKILSYQRSILCSACKGTGAATQEGICETCDGRGKIESSVLDILKRSPQCPVCKGSGIKPGEECPQCRGAKRALQKKEHSFILSLEHYHRKNVIFPGLGNQIDCNHFGTLHVRLKITHNGPLSVEDDYYVLYRKILPVQKIIGDEGSLHIYGRNILFNICPGATEAYTEDKVRPGLTQTIRVKFTDLQTPFTEETKALYKKILKIEKSLKK